MSYVCESQQQDARPVLSIRTRTAVENLPQILGQSFRKIIQYLGSQGQAPVGPPFVAYYNMDMQDIDLEIGFPVAGELPGQEDMRPSAIPAGLFASTLHTGPYPEMRSAYETLNAWMAEKGLRPTGVAYEHYLNSPMDTPPADLQTIIEFPVLEG